MSSIKEAVTKFPVHELIRKRWSARSFSDKIVTEETLLTLIEAASWSWSANNEQPWKFIIAAKGTEAFDKIQEAFMPGNKPWTKNAGAFIVSLAKNNFEKDGKPNAFAMHDLGAANMLISIQAQDLGLSAHPTAGFDRNMIREKFSIGEDLNPLVVFAVGCPDTADKLEEPYKTRELTPRTRKSLNDLILK